MAAGTGSITGARAAVDAAFVHTQAAPQPTPGAHLHATRRQRINHLLQPLATQRVAGVDVHHPLGLQRCAGGRRQAQLRLAAGCGRQGSSKQGND